RPIITELKAIKDQYEDKSKQAKTLATTLEDLAKDKMGAVAAFEEANKLFNGKVQDEEAAKPLLNEAKKLDTQLSEKAKQINLAREDLSKVIAKEKHQTNQYENAKKELVALEEKIGTLQKWKEAHESRRAIAEEEQLILSKLNDAEGILERLQEYNYRIQNA